MFVIFSNLHFHTKLFFNSCCYCKTTAAAASVGLPLPYLLFGGVGMKTQPKNLVPNDIELHSRESRQ